MDIRDASQPDDAVPDRNRPVMDGSRDGDLSRDLTHDLSADLSPAEDALHTALRRLVDELPPPADPVTAVLRRARRIRSRRRIVRACASTTALVLAVLCGPAVAGQIRHWHRPGEAVAAPPAAVLDLTVAYPAAEASPSLAQATTSSAPDDSPPANALGWPARGDKLPSPALDLARSYLLAEATPSAERADRAVANQLWAKLAPDKQTWQYAVEGWTVGPDGAASAQILAGEYTPAAAKKSADATVKNSAKDTAKTTLKDTVTAARPATAEMTVFATPVRFAHPPPGTTPDPAAAARIAEYSIWFPVPNQLLVLGAPQVQTVYYAKDGVRFVAEATQDGVALFPRAKAPKHGALADLVQVRDDRNQALTPPVGWSTPDLSLAGPGGTSLAPPAPATPTMPTAPTPLGRWEPSAVPSGVPSSAAPITAPATAPSGPAPQPSGTTGSMASPTADQSNWPGPAGTGSSATALPTPTSMPPDPSAGLPTPDPPGLVAVW